VILAEARVVVGGGERGVGFRVDREALFNLLLTLRNAIVSDGVVIVDGIDEMRDDVDLIDLASAAGFSRIETTSMQHVELRR
jgi:hypothetical protein